MSNEINMNFDDNRDLQYPNLDDVEYADDELIMKFINNLPAPSNGKQMAIFNMIWEQFHLRGGK